MSIQTLETLQTKYIKGYKNNYLTDFNRKVKRKMSKLILKMSFIN